MTGSGPPFLRGPQVPKVPVMLAPADLCATLDETYVAVVAAANAQPDIWHGWKLGGTNHASRKAFGVDELYYGALTKPEILHRPDCAPGLPLIELKGEVEIALRIGPDGATPDAWCVALEMPSSPITNLMDCGVRALVADRCAAGALLLGPVSTLPPGGAGADSNAVFPEGDGHDFVLEADGKTLDTAGLDALTAPPMQQFADFLAMARRHGLRTRHGQWVATGGITNCCALCQGARVRVLLSDVPQLDLTISTVAAGDPSAMPVA